jgi:predicted GNAT family acetyltransferase
MEIRFFEDINDFINATEETLLQNESFYNLKLGLSNAIRNNNIEVTTPLYFAIFDNQSLVGCALRTNTDKPLAISKMPEAAIELLIKTLIEMKIVLCGVVGEVEAVKFFKELWLKEHTSLTFKLNIHLGIYETKVIINPKEQAEIFLATHAQRDVVCAFIKGFSMECFPNREHKDDEIEKLSIRHINNKSLYLLKNNLGQIVSMAASTRGSTNGGTISLVYTPEDHRGKGYGSLVTAKVSEIVLKEKKFANLFTDLTNPTSNSIYKKIGYKMIGENIHYDFF